MDEGMIGKIMNISLEIYSMNAPDIRREIEGGGEKEGKRGGEKEGKRVRFKE